MNVTSFIAVFATAVVSVVVAQAQGNNSAFQYNSKGAHVTGTISAGGGATGGGRAGAGAGAGVQMGIGSGPVINRGGSVFYIVPKSASRASVSSNAGVNSGAAAARESSAAGTPEAAVVSTAPPQEPLNEAPVFFLGDAPSGVSLGAAAMPAPAVTAPPPGMIPATHVSNEKADQSRAERVQPISEVKGPAFNDRDSLLSYQRSEAEKGNPQAQFALGIRYLTGNGVEQNQSLAQQWLEKASAQGNLKARSKLRELKAPTGDS